MEAPKIKIGNKTYTAIRPKTKLWRKLVRYRSVHGDPEKVAENPEEHMAAIDDLFELMADALPDEVTADMLENETYMDDFTKFAGRTMAWIEFVVSGRTEKLPEKN